MRKFLTDMKKDQESTFESLHLKIDDVTSGITKTVEKEVKDLRDYVDLGLSRVTDRLKQIVATELKDPI